MPLLRFFDGVEWNAIDANDAKTLNGKSDKEFAPISHVGATLAEDGTFAHPIATPEDPGFMSADDRVKLDLLRTQEIFISETRPLEPFEGMVWYKPSAEDWWKYLDGDFRYAGGGSLDNRLGRMNANMIDIGIEVELLKRAELRGVNANIFLETFQDIDDIKLTRGTYDSVNKRLTL